MKIRTSLVSMVCALCLSLVVGVLVLTAVPAASEIKAETVDICPETLNLKTNATWITVYIELPEGYNVSNINVTTVLLGPVNASWGSVEENKLMVKFDMKTVINYIWAFKLYHMEIPLPREGVPVTLTVTGELTDGTPFVGSDTIRAICSS